MSTSLARGLQLIEVLAGASRPLTLAEIAAKLGRSKSGIHALLAALVRAGYVEHAPGGIYNLGLKAWQIGRSVPASYLVQRVAPVMTDLAASACEGVILGVLDGFEVAYLHLVEGEQAVRVHAAVGERIPAHCTSTGLALLAQYGDAAVDALLPARLPAVTRDTLTERRALLAELRRVRTRGYAINRGGWRLDVGGIAAAIPTVGGDVALIAGLCIAVPRYRMTRAWIGRNAPRLVAAAGRAGRLLGISAPPRAAMA